MLATSGHPDRTPSAQDAKLTQWAAPTAPGPTYREQPVDIDGIVARLSEATDTELADTLNHIREQAQGLADATSTEDVQKLTGYAETARTIRAEQTRRADLANAKAAALSELAVMPTPGNDGDPIDGDADQDKQEARGTTTKPTSKLPDGTEHVAASGARAPLGSIGRQAPQPEATPVAGRVAVTTRLSGPVPGRAVGEQLDRDGLAASFAGAMTTVFSPRGAAGDGRHDVARFTYEYPEDRVLRAGATWAENTRKIEAGQDPQAIVAAGGYCAPLEIIYDINVIGVTNRPIMSALNRFQVERGGIQYRPPFDALSSTVLGMTNDMGSTASTNAHTGGLGIWTATDDTADTTQTANQKGCAVVTCPGLEAASVYSTYLCLEFPNFTSRFDPEWADATMQAALIAAARFQENQLLTRLLNGSTDVTQTGDAGSKLLLGPGASFVQPGSGAGANVSSARDLLVTLDRAVAYFRNRHRLDSLGPLTYILPLWVKDLIRADLTRGAFPYDLEALAIADAQIEAWFTARGVTPVFHLDGLDQTQVGGSAGPTISAQWYPNTAAAGAIVPEFPDMVDSLLFATGDWLYLDGGVLDLGLVRDSTLNARNRYRTFTESFEGVAFRGIETLRLGIYTGVPTGAAVGTISAAQITS